MSKKTYHPNLRIIKENDFGYIGKCPCCGEVQFCIGNVVSFMPEVDFLKLYYSFKKIDQRLEEKIINMPNGEKLLLRTPVDNILLSLAREEFEKVIELFDAMSANLKLVESLERIENMN